jgi:hypothetical protein
LTSSFLRHSAYLRGIGLCRRGRWRSKDAAARIGTRTPSFNFVISIRSCVGSGRCVGNYICVAQIIQGNLVVTSILRPLTGASNSSTSASTPDSDSSDDYPEIGVGACGEPVKDDYFIYKVALNDDRSSNTSNRYPTIRRSEASDARTPSGGLAQNLNSDFNVVRVQAIMETIQCMAPDGSPLAVLTQ